MVQDYALHVLHMARNPDSSCPGNIVGMRACLDRFRWEPFSLSTIVSLSSVSGDLTTTCGDDMDKFVVASMIMPAGCRKRHCNAD